MARMIFVCTHGREDAERATLPFVAANIAAQVGQDSIVLLTIEGAWLCTDGYADAIQAEGLPALAPLVREFVEKGGTIWGCGACTKPRGITEADLVKGATIVGAATVIEAVAGGAQMVPFA